MIQIQTIDNGLFLDSREAARVLGIDHRSVYRLLMDNSDMFGTVRFEITPRADGNTGGDQAKHALVTERQALILITFVRNSEAAKNAKIKLVDAFLEARRRLKEIGKPKTAIEWAQAFIDAEKERLRLAEQNQVMKPKAEAYDRFLSAENAVCLRDALKSIGLPPRKTLDVLKRDGILFVNSADDILPYQEQIEAGRFRVRMVPVVAGGRAFSRQQTLVTPKGLAWLERNYRTRPRTLLTTLEAEQRVAEMKDREVRDGNKNSN